jgi:hypothetical protein
MADRTGCARRPSPSFHLTAFGKNRRGLARLGRLVGAQEAERDRASQGDDESPAPADHPDAVAQRLLDRALVRLEGLERPARRNALSITIASARSRTIFPPARRSMLAPAFRETRERRSPSPFGERRRRRTWEHRFRSRGFEGAWRERTLHRELLQPAPPPPEPGDAQPRRIRTPILEHNAAAAAA